MCVLFGVVQLPPLCCISHMAVLYSNKIQIQAYQALLSSNRRGSHKITKSGRHMLLYHKLSYVVTTVIIHLRGKEG